MEDDHFMDQGLFILPFSWFTHRWSWVIMRLTRLFWGWQQAFRGVWSAKVRLCSYSGAIGISGSPCSATTPFPPAFLAFSREFASHYFPKSIREKFGIFDVFLISIHTSSLVQYTFLLRWSVPRKAWRWAFLYLRDSGDFKLGLKVRNFLHFSLLNYN